MRGLARRQSGAPLLRWLAGLSLVLALLHGGLWLLWGRPDPVVVLSWYVPMVHSFMTLAALSIAFLAFGRYAVLQEPSSLWLGVGFSSFAIFSVFYVLSWPGLLPGDKSLLGTSLNIVGWYWHLQFTALALFLLMALMVQWPKPGAAPQAWKVWIVAGLLATMLAGWMVAILEVYLPPLVSGGSFTALNAVWSYGILFAMIAGSVLSARRQAATQDALFSYISIADLILAFAVITSITGGRFYDLWWYWQRALWIAGLSVMLVGLLSEYVGLFRRERHYAGLAEKQAAQLSATIESMVDVVMVCNQAGVIVSVNQAGRDLLGLFDEDLGMPVDDAMTRLQVRYPDGRPVSGDESSFMLALRGQAVVGSEILVRRADGGDIRFSINTAPVRNSAGDVVMVVGVLRDVTELKRLQELREEFISAAAHELKTPVTTIKGYAQMLMHWAPGKHDEREQRAIQAINRQCDRIDQRVKQMLEFVRSHSASHELRREGFDLGELATEVLERIAATGESRQVVMRSHGPVPVEADRERMDEVLTTLVVNAIRYSRGSEPVWVDVRTSGDGALVSVEDHGTGISRERQPYVFEPFYEPFPSGSPDYQGVVDLSLYLAKVVVERHMGRIWFDSVEGEGTTFHVSLPLQEFVIA